MRITIRTTISAFAIGTVLAGAATRTAAQQRDDRLIRVDTLEGGRVVISNPDAPQTGPQGAPTLVEVLRIGSLDDTCDALGYVTSVTVDGDGRIYVADQQANEIRVFSPGGECVRTFGRSGEGPGEFGWLAGIAWQPPGHLWAFDAMRHRFTVFDSLGTVSATHRLQLGRTDLLPRRLWVDNGGHLHFWFHGFGNIVKYATGPGLDSLARVSEPTIPPDPRMSYTREVGTGDYRISMEFVMPYAPRVQWTVNSGGNIWQASTSAFAIHETTYTGDTLRTIRLDREPPRLEGQERDSVAAAAGIPARRLPAHKYALETIRSGPDGWVWIATERGATRGWEVFDERGYYLGRVASPVPIEKQPAPFFGSGMVTGVTLGELDVPYVVQLRIVRGG